MEVRRHGADWHLYKEGSYRPLVRCGGDCDRCGRRSNCPVSDHELKKWENCGMGCLSWIPEEPNDAYQV